MFDTLALKQMWQNAWFVVTTLLASSVISGAIILERWKSLKAVEFDRDEVLIKLRDLLTRQKMDDAIDYCQNMSGPMGKILSQLIAAAKENRSISRETLERFGDRLVRASAADLHTYITGLGTIGSTAPFVGLFGTVVGIIHAFKAIAENAGGGPGVVARGISEALITTALGLFVAIPAVVAYNLFTRKIDMLEENMNLCMEEVVDLATYSARGGHH